MILFQVAAALLLAAPQAPEAQIRTVERVEVGEPFELSIEIRHAAGVAVVLDPRALDDAWVLLDASGAATLAAGEGRAATSVRWTVVALEPGEEVLPALWASIDGGPPRAIPVLGDGVTATGVLAPGEDEPRPPAGFRDAPAPAGGPPRWAWPLGVLALLAVAAAAFLRRRRARAPVEVPPTAAERLRAIDPEALAEPAAVQAAYYEITAVLRGAIDERLGRDLAAWTDEEWLAATRGQLPESEYDLVADVLRQSAEVKYGTARPTHWGAQETLERALSAVAGEVPAYQGAGGREA